MIFLTASQYFMVPPLFCPFSTLFANAVVHSSFAEKIAVLNSLRALRSFRRLFEEGVLVCVAVAAFLLLDSGWPVVPISL